MIKIRRALISLSDKNGIAEFARGLADFGIEIMSTGGTSDLLKKNGVPASEISVYTGFPEMMDGRVKSLHPRIHGAILGVRDNPQHVREVNAYDIKWIDMVVVNLYPFESTIAKGCSFEEAVENIDVGGPTMIRAAAKNHKYVAVITAPEDYRSIFEEMKANDGCLSEQTLFILAKKAFQLTARYDAAISNYLGKIVDGNIQRKFPDTLSFQFKKAQDLRYGENPHQLAAFYTEREINIPCVSNAIQLQGKELSFNNILDLDAAFEAVMEFDSDAAVIIKHNNPCGVAISDNGLAQAYRTARACDPVSAFGGVVGLNRPVDAITATEITSEFIEAVIAPDFSQDALDIFNSHKNIRLMKTPGRLSAPSDRVDIKRVSGGILIQERDDARLRMEDIKTVTVRTPTADEIEAMLFAWKVCKHVKSNAIVYALKDRTVGIGAGQMSRVDSSRIAALKGGTNIKGAVVASDAFFPFRDGVDILAEAGATAIIQPGGSMRDKEVIEAANEHGIAMIFTGIRHFRH